MRLILAAALVLLAEPAIAEPPLSVRTSDVSPAALTERFIDRFETICGSPQQRGVTEALVGPSKQFAECKASLKVAPDANPTVRASFAEALARFK